MAIQLEVSIKICLIKTFICQLIKVTLSIIIGSAWMCCMISLESSHKILLCGDLNGTLLPTRNNKHDAILKYFVKEHSLSTGSFDCVEPTFSHFNGVVTSQIDYILTSDADLFYKYSVLKKDAFNLSSHVPVQAHIKLPDCMVKNNDFTVIITKLIPKTIFSWNKINSDMFIEHLQRNLNETDSTNVNSTVNNMTTCLQIAAQKSVT